LLAMCASVDAHGARPAKVTTWQSAGDSLLELALATLLRPIVQQGQYGIGAAAQNIVSKASLQPLQHQLCTPTERMELIRLQCVGIA